MRIRWKHWNHKCTLIRLVLGVLILGVLTTVFAGQEREALPRVVRMEVPSYPILPQKAHAEGVIRLRITTDGERASSVEVVSGLPLLVPAAKENVETWEFEQHRPTTFDTTFRYSLLESECDSSCNCGSKEIPFVLLRLPTEVDVTAEEALICDPIERDER